MRKNLLISLFVLFMGTMNLSAVTYYCCVGGNVTITQTITKNNPSLWLGGNPQPEITYFLKHSSMAYVSGGSSCSVLIGSHTYTYQYTSCGTYSRSITLQCNTAGTYTVYFAYQYRQETGCASAPGAFENGTATIIVLAATEGGTISGGIATICEGSSTGTMTLSGNSGSVTNWQHKLNTGSWTTISGTAGLTSYSATPTSAGTWYYRAIVSGPCSPVYSTEKTITVRPQPTASITPSTGSVCPSTNLALTGGTTGGTSPYSSYTWSGLGLSSTATQNPSFNYATPGTYNLTYKFKDTYGCWSNEATGTVTVNPLPSAAGSIFGSTTVCQSQSSVAYSITAIDNATSYNWSYSGGGATITNGTTRTPTISFSPNASSGTLTVYGVNACGNGTSSSRNITVNPLPSAASTITGSATVCQSQSGVNYNVGSITNATGYVWSYSGTGATITDGNTSAPTISYSSSATTGSLTIYGTNTCGNGTSNSKTITVNPLPGAADIITGSASPCQGSSGNAYSIAAVSNATSYTWDYSGSGATITNGSTNSISIAYNTSATSGNLTVKAVNACGEGSQKSKTITISPLPSAAGPITGLTTICQGTPGNAFSINSIPNATSYNWIYGGTGATITSGTTMAPTIAFSTSATTGSLSVYGVNACGNGSSNNKTITISPLPAAAGAISGSSSVCQGQSGVSYSVTSISDATNYAWSYSGTGANFTNGTTRTPTISFAANATSGNLTVYGTNSCGNGTLSANYAINVNAMPTTSAITGNASPGCSATGISYSVINTAGSSYVWSLPSGASVTGGSGTNNITVSFGTSNGNVSVIETNSAACPGSAKNMTISLVGCGLDAAFTADNTTICEGNSVIFTNTSTGTTGSSTYAWDFGSGASPATASTVGPHTVTYSTGGSKSVRLIITEGVNDTLTRTGYIIVNPLPVSAGTISGSASVCQGQTTISYNVPAITNATGYIWSYSGTGATINNPTTNTPTIDFATIATSGKLTVKGTNVCGNGIISSDYNITINPLPDAAGGVTGTSTVCQGTAGVAYSIVSIPNATAYSWTYSGTGTTINGTTNNVTADFGSNATSGNITVRGINACGNGTLTNYAVTINNSPTPKFLYTPSEHECTGTSVAHIVDPQAGQPINNYNFKVNGVSKQNGIGNTYTTSSLISTDVVTMEASSANGCMTAITSALIVDDQSNGGTLTGGDANVCQGNSSGIITVGSSTGNILRWEKSSNGGTSWSIIASTGSTYSETLGVIGNYIFRVVVKNGVCAEAASANSSTIQVHASTVGGGVMAAAKTLSLGQSATLNLSANNGSVVKWQYRQAGQTSWSDIANTSSQLVHAPAVPDSIFYKAVVQNSVCPSVESTSDFVMVLNPIICIIRYDAETGKNKIIWERTGTDVKSYKIYAVNGKTYSAIATIPFANFSQYIDSGSNPSSQRYSYAMSTISNSDVESAKSNVHRTMLLQASAGVLKTDANLLWQPYVDESEKISPDSVFIYKGKTKDKMTLLKGLPYDNTMYIDHEFDGQSAYYQLAFNIPVCTPTGTLKAESGPYAQSLSNIAEYKAPISLAGENMIPAAVYPNPTSGLFNLEYELKTNNDVTIEIVNGLGTVEKIIEMKDIPIGRHTLQLSALDCNMSYGIHYIKIIAGDKISIVKLTFL